MLYKDMFTDDSDRVAVIKLHEILYDDCVCSQVMRDLLADLRHGGHKIKITRDRVKYPASPMACNVYTMTLLGHKFSMTRTPIPKSDSSPKALEFLRWANRFYVEKTLVLLSV